MQVKHHGLWFGIDVQGWGRHTSSGERAAFYLGEWLRSLGEAETRALFEALKSGNDESAIAIRAVDAGNATALRVFVEEAWVSHPNSGHNCSLYVG